jgi:hypothetical protein
MSMNSPRSLLLAVFLVLSNNLLWQDASFAKPRSKYKIEGTFTILTSYKRDNFLTTDGENPFCFGTNGYDDLKSNVPITITDEQNKIIAIGKTGYGSKTYEGCVMSFKIDNIPKSSFYSIEVGRRGKIIFSFDQMVESKWRVGLIIGDK